MSKTIPEQVSELLSRGWDIRGFQPVVGAGQTGDGAAAGYSILLQKQANLALATIALDDGTWKLSGLHPLVGTV
jgi:hypothetical protein